MKDQPQWVQDMNKKDMYTFRKNPRVYIFVFVWYAGWMAFGIGLVTKILKVW